MEFTATPELGARIALALQVTELGTQPIRAARQFIPAFPALIVTGESKPERMQEVHAAGIAVICTPVTSQSLLAKIAMLTTVSYIVT